MRFKTQLKVDQKYRGIEKKPRQNSLQMSKAGVKQVFAVSSLMWNQNSILQTCQHGSHIQSCKNLPCQTSLLQFSFKKILELQTA